MERQKASATLGLIKIRKTAAPGHKTEAGSVLMSKDWTLKESGLTTMSLFVYT